MKRTKIEAMLAVIVTLTLAVTAAVWGYHKGRSAVLGSTSFYGTVQQAAVPESYAVPRQIPVLCFHGIGTPSTVPGRSTTTTRRWPTSRPRWPTCTSNGYQTITPQQYTAWLDGTGSSPGQAYPDHVR